MEKLYVFYNLNYDNKFLEIYQLKKKNFNKLIKYKPLQWSHIRNDYICDILYNKNINYYYEGPYIFYI